MSSPHGPSDRVLLMSEGVEDEEKSFFGSPPPTPRKRRILMDSIGFYNKIKRQEVCPNVAQMPAEGIVRRYTLINGDFSVQVINLGATVISVRMKDKDGEDADVVLGFENIDDYVCKYGEYKLGSTLGRYAGLISDGYFNICMNEYFLNCNYGRHHKDGGMLGFSKVLWDSWIQDEKVIMTYMSPDREECYPGHLFTQVSFHVTEENALVIESSAKTSLPTPVCIAQNIYLNLAGHFAGFEGLKSHVLMVNANYFIDTSRETLVPTGSFRPVDKGCYDFRVPRLMENAFKKSVFGGYNETYCIIQSRRDLSFAARLLHPPSGRMVEIFTDHPGLLVNTGMDFPDPEMPFYPVKWIEEKIIINASSSTFLKDEYKKKTTYQEYVFPRYSQMGLDEVPETDDRECEVPSPRREEFEEPSFPHRDILVDCEPLDKDPAESDEEETEYKPPCIPQPMIGKNGIGYSIRSGIALVPMAFPDSIKNKNFPNPILYPGERYSRTVVYKFSLAPDPKKRLPSKMSQPYNKSDQGWESKSSSTHSTKQSVLSESETPKLTEIK